MLTQRDIDHFQTFGYVILRGYLDDVEMDRMRGEVSEAMNEAFANDPFDGTKRHWLPLANPRQPFMQSLLEDPRFHGAAQRLSGKDDLIVLTVDANRYVGDTGWHSDGSRSLLGVKFVAYLDAMTAGTGALRVIPGSHREPYLSRIQSFLDAHRDEIGIDDVPAVACETVPGDVVAFNYPTFHASMGGSNDRRMCTIEFLEFPTTDDQRGLMIGAVAGLIEGTNKTWERDRYPWFHPEWIANPDGNPVRQRMIDRMRDLGIFELAGATS